ncbi:MAG: cytochrome c oxidase subunit II [Actinomycetota bacterium]|nr:cytochrome c oxidase subunit II [Actinomycetota bacterium]
MFSHLPPVPLGLVSLGALAVSGCAEGFSFGAPDPVSSEGQEVLELWRGAHWAAAGVAVLIWGLVVYSVIRYRRRNDDVPSQTPENIPLEIAYTVTPLVIVAVLFAFTVLTQQQVTALSDDPDVVVDVTGFQWSWQFHYPEEGVTVVSDGVGAPRMVLPVGSSVRFRVETADVIHSFWVPRFLVKTDLIPEIDNEFEVNVVEEGEWVGRCAEFCGLEHYRMLFEVAAVPEAEYRTWLDEQRTVAA